MIIDGGDCEIGLESTIIALDGDGALLLRPGAVTYDALCCVLEKVEISAAAMGEMTADDRPLAPGMKYRHYAPSSPLVLLEGSDEDFINYIKQKRSIENCAVICSPVEAKALGGEPRAHRRGRRLPHAGKAALLGPARSRQAGLRGNLCPKAPCRRPRACAL